MRVYPFGRLGTPQDNQEEWPYSYYYRVIMKYLVTIMLICIMTSCINAILQNPTTHPLIKVHEKLAETLSLTNCWICRHLSRHPEDPIGLHELPVPLDQYETGKVCLVTNTTWKCDQQKYYRYPRCVVLPNTQAEYKLSPRPGANTTHNMFPICFRNQFFGQNPEVRYMGEVPLGQCVYTLSFDNKTGNWELENEELFQRNWTYTLNNTQRNETITYWNLTMEGNSVLVGPEGVLYDPLKEVDKDGNQAPEIVSQILLFPLWTARCSYVAPWANVSVMNATWKEYKYCRTFDPPEGVGLPRFKFSIINSQIQGGMYFVCGKTAYKVLPQNWEGTCSLAYLAPNITVIPNISSAEPLNMGSFAHRYKRDTSISAVRKNWVVQLLHVVFPQFGVFDLQLALINMSAELAVAFNATREAIGSVQLEMDSAAHLVIQNRLALDLITMKMGGVCVLIQHEYQQKCCYYVNQSSEIELDVGKIKNAVQVFEKGGQTDGGNFSLSWLWSLFKGWGWLKDVMLLIMAVVLSCLLVQCLPAICSCLKACKPPPINLHEVNRAMVQREEVQSLMAIDPTVLTKDTGCSLPSVVYVPMDMKSDVVGVRCNVYEEVGNYRPSNCELNYSI